MHHAWYKNAIFYSLDVDTYYDYNGDGIGDFQGLIRKLDYIASLGITCIWLLPFFPNSQRDNGYDVTDYCAIDPRLGTLGDFTDFMHKAADYGIRIVIDLVVNHTSNQHPWFLEARKNPESKYRDYYVWTEKPLDFEKEHLMFRGEEDSIWTLDEEARQYYLHRFYKEQPDLNISNPHVREEIMKIMGFWLDLGVSGFRVDAAEFLIESYGLDTTEDLAIILEEMRSYVNSHRHDAILLGETNVLPEKMDIYLHEEKRMHMLFNFFVNQHLFSSVAADNPATLIKALLQLPKVHPTHQWLNFLRQHDELSLSLLEEADKTIVFDRFAPEENMRIFGRGIRRRLAPMLGWNRDLLRFFYSLLFSLPGIPLIRYGDEIAMGDDLTLPGRESVRTPMQWTPTQNGGFSSAAKEDLASPVISDQWGGFKMINVISSQSDETSLLHWIRELISVRKLCSEIGRGTMEIIESTQAGLMLHLFDHEEGKLLIMHNFSAAAVSFPFRETGLDGVLAYSIFRNHDSAFKDDIVHLSAKGYLWFKLLAF